MSILMCSGEVSVQRTKLAGEHWPTWARWGSWALPTLHASHHVPPSTMDSTSCCLPATPSEYSLIKWYEADMNLYSVRSVSKLMYLSSAAFSAPSLTPELAALPPKPTLLSCVFCYALHGFARSQVVHDSCFVDGRARSRARTSTAYRSTR